MSDEQSANPAFEPGYDQIADEIFHACEAAGLDIVVTRGGRPVDGPELVLARVLDQAGLIATPVTPVDWAARFLAASEAAEVTDASIYTTVELRQLGRDRLPSEPPQVVEAIARALTGEATS